MRTIRGLDAPLAHRSLDIPCQVASPQSLTPFLQAVPVYPRWQTIHKYHWTPDLCLEKSCGAAAYRVMVCVCARFRRMNLFCLSDGTEFTLVWSVLRSANVAKLVTVHFFDE